MLHSISTWWQHFWGHTEFWNAFWPAVFGAISGSAALAWLERRHQRENRIDKEVSECNELIFILGQMLSTLEDIRGFFDAPTKELGRKPEWNEIGAFVGAPDASPDFIIGEYTFLLQDDDRSKLAPQFLGRVYNAEANFKQVLARLNERSQLWHQFNEYRAASQFRLGKEAVIATAGSGALGARLKELTRWLEEDLVEWIPVFKNLIPELRNMLTTKYPHRRFILLWPNENQNSPPL